MTRLRSLTLSIFLVLTVLVGCGGDGGTGGDGGSGGGSGGEGGATVSTDDGGGGQGGEGGCVIVDDENECTVDTCDGSTPVADNTACDKENGDNRCSNGACLPVTQHGYDSSLCAGGWDYHSSASESGDVALHEIDFPESGFVSKVSVLIPIGPGCTNLDRTVYITQVVPPGFPMSPNVHETIFISSLLIEKGEDDGNGSKRVTLPLSSPLYGQAGDHAYMGIDMYPTGCLASCNDIDADLEELQPPPAGKDFWCTDVEGMGTDTSIDGCAAMDDIYPGVEEATLWGMTYYLVKTGS